MILEKLQIIATVSLDFYTNNIKTINVKQCDTNSRFIHVFFTEHGKKVSLNQSTMSVIARYKKPDGKFGLRDVEILEDGSVLIELNEQMTVVSGKTQLDVMILEESGIKADSFADITSFEEYGVAVLSAMPLSLNVVATPIQGAELESEYDFTPLNECFASVKAIESDIMAKNIEWTNAEELRNIAENGEFDENGELITVGRVQAEQDRVDAEKQREENVSKLIQNCQKSINDKIDEFESKTNDAIEDCQIKTDAAIQECNDKTDSAAELATNAAGDANTAAASANNAATYANSEAQKCNEVYQAVSSDAEAVIEECETARDRANLAAQNCEDIVAGVGVVMHSEKGVAGGVASLDENSKIPLEQIPDGIQAEVDWNAEEDTSGGIKNKPSIAKGTGTDSVVIGIGNASGDYSVAGGTNDQNLIKKLTGSNQSVDKAKATGGMSVAFGANSEAITAGTGVIGFNSTAGCKGYYWWSIDFSTNTIQLSTSQKSLLNLTRDLPQKLSLVKGDTISIVNGDKHDLCSTILAVDTVNGTIQVDSLPFTEIETPLALAFDDYAITCPTKPLAGEVDLGYGAFAIGLNNKAVGSFSHVEGYNNTGAGDFSHAEGKDTVAGYVSHAEGDKSRALGIYTHAEGYNTIAEGDMSHSEGCNTIAKGLFSHVEGRDTQATSHTAHAEGYGTHAEGSNSHAEGQNTIASGSKSHAEGFGTHASGENSHTEGYRTTASEYASHAEGYGTTASGYVSHAEGYYTTASGEYSHAEGANTIAEGSNSHAEGQSSQAIGLYAHSEGYHTTANGESSHAEGQHTTTEGTASHAEGASTTAGGLFSHAEGRETQATSHTAHAEGYGTHAEGSNSHAEGQNTIASGSKSHAEGFGTIAGGANSHVQGKHNIKDTENKYAHIIGYGSGDSESARANIHTVDWTGLGYFKSGTTTTGADYAEYFEWLDGNPNNEDRVGLLVTLDREKIKLANTDDEILGIISGTTAVLGDNYEFEWNGKYLTDNFGRIIYEDVEEFDEVIVGEDEDGNLIIEKVSLGFFKYPVLNPEYDPEQSYVNRADRPEWDTVGMLGKLYLRDDGTCQVNGYATVGEYGIATASSEKTNMRVLSRVNESVVRVLLK